MYMQIVGKARLGLTPIQNHWWNIAFYLTARGLTTSAMPADRGMSLDIEFDLLSHEVVCRTSHGEIRNIPLRPVSVAQFFEEFTKTLASLGVSVKIDPMPVEVANPIRCDIDTVHCSYDSDAVTRKVLPLTALRIADALLKSAFQPISMARSARSISSGDRLIWLSRESMASEQRRGRVPMRFKRKPILMR